MMDAAEQEVRPWESEVAAIRLARKVGKNAGKTGYS
jgi:hypothetical protein